MGTSDVVLLDQLIGVVTLPFLMETAHFFFVSSSFLHQFYRVSGKEILWKG